MGGDKGGGEGKGRGYIEQERLENDIGHNMRWNDKISFIIKVKPTSEFRVIKTSKDFLKNIGNNSPKYRCFLLAHI